MPNNDANATPFHICGGAGIQNSLLGSAAEVSLPLWLLEALVVAGLLPATIAWRFQDVPHATLPALPAPDTGGSHSNMGHSRSPGAAAHINGTLNVDQCRRQISFA